MFPRRALLLIPLAFLLGLDSPRSPDLFHFKQTGFSIAPLQGKPGADNYPALTMLLPVTDSYSANVNVNIQPYTGSLDDYIALSAKGFAEEHFNLISQTRTAPDTVYFEYFGLIQGNQMHWYAKAVARPGHIYLATATALSEQWNADSNSLKACVTSFQADADADATPPR